MKSHTRPRRWPVTITAMLMDLSECFGRLSEHAARRAANRQIRRLRRRARESERCSKCGSRSEGGQ